MKLRRVLLRWYKSFHLNYRGLWEKGEVSPYRPWNKILPSVGGEEFPFIEIPIEHDITTIVGANESGKSHLLNAIAKVVRGTGIDDRDEFKRTDLCHYAGIRTQNVEAWPNIGLQFSVDEQEFSRLKSVLVNAIPQTGQTAPSIALILAGENEWIGYLFVEPAPDPIRLNKEQLESVQALLPSVQYIDSRAELASELPIAALIAAYGSTPVGARGLPNRAAVENAINLIRELPALNPQQQAPPTYIQQIEEAKSKLNELTAIPGTSGILEMRLFKEILGIRVETLQYVHGLSLIDRGYIEGQISKWNEEIDQRLNLAHFWRQDEQFSLTVNYKDGIIYFEIRDKTGSVYTFNERSSGLKFFLSYYIQAKAMELSNRNRNSIILMDEPDSALSILGQRNLLSVFESLVSPESSGQTCQLIYTTHSPYLINRNFLRRVRVVKKEDAEEGTQYIEHARARRYEPVRTALGIDSSSSLFLGADNILLEGATDQYLLAELIRIFATPANVGEFLDLNNVVIVSADGVGNVINVLEQSRWADEPIPPTAVIVDGDAQAKDVVDRITEKWGKNKASIDPACVAMLPQLIKPFGANSAIVTIEDLVPKAIYAEAIKSYLGKWLPDTLQQHEEVISRTLDDPEFGSKGLGSATRDLFSKIKPEAQGDYDKMGVLQQVVRTVQANCEQPDAPTDQLRRHTVMLCDFIRETLSNSRVAAAKHSATQAIKRIVHDFDRANQDNVPITRLQTLFRRFEDELRPVGAEGEACLRIIDAHLAEIARLREAGQERISGGSWTAWKANIEAIKKNPLSVGQLAPPAGAAAQQA